MAKKHEKTRAAIFEKPTKATIKWAAIEALFVFLGGTIEERKGSRVAIIWNGETTIYHRPHPKPDAKMYAVEMVRALLSKHGEAP